MAAITAFNYDRRRTAGAELDFGHYDRQLIERINQLSLESYGVEVFSGPREDQRLRTLEPDSGARFVADVNMDAYQPHARLRERNRKLHLKRPAATQVDDEPPPDGEPPPDVEPPNVGEPDVGDSGASATMDTTVEPTALTTHDGAAAADSGAKSAFATLMAAQKPTNSFGKSAKSAKAAFKQVAKKCACNAQCLAEFADHKRRNMAKSHPGRGFKHHPTCPKKQAADAVRGPH